MRRFAHRARGARTAWRAVSGRMLMGLVLSSGALAGAGTASPANATQASPVRHASAPSAMDRRVASLTKALELDANQKQILHNILATQREQVRQIWGDASVPSAYRIAATQAASDKAGDAIRAMLNAEQKQKYNLSRPPPDLSAEAARPGLARWMDAVQHD